MRFAADCMLGTLAKWLILLGHDVVYYRRIEDADLVRLAVAANRTLLTRDRGLRLRKDSLFRRATHVDRMLADLLRLTSPRPAG